ncbi:unnamed protein product [Hymenolepis diminuta]|uniref:RING-type domain-containing protein n=1 Tax=Hymenolepis diminuta TaxID=6216 RepID=A0A564YGE1_HYMDI|nr:unnamed protein product [Hymenolepis diminuta]
MATYGGSCSRLSGANLSFRNPRRGSSHVNLSGAKGSAKTSSRVKVMNLKPLEEMVTCPIDLNFLEDPRLLPCGHVFCCQCLDSYICQILTCPPDRRGAPLMRPQLPCPICRALHNIPESNTARDYPKSFNHSFLLEYIRSKAFLIEPTDSGNASGGPSSSRSSFHSSPPAGRRHTSINVTSDALNGLVADIEAIKRGKNNTVLNLAQLLHGVRKLAESQKEEVEKRVLDEQCKGSANQLNIPEPELVEPSAPPEPPSTPAIPKTIPSPKCQRNGSARRCSNGRFKSSAHHALGDRADPERSSYTNYRELLTARTVMMRNSDYVCLRKNLGQCDGVPKEGIPCVGMHILPNQLKTHVMQYTIGPASNTGHIYLWRKRVSIHPGRESFTLNANLSKSSDKNSEAIVKQCWNIDDLVSMGKLEVQYVRFFKNRVYMSVIIRQPSENLTNSGDIQISADLIDPGLLICCTLPDPNHKFTADELNGSDSTKHKLNIIGMSSIFLRDTVGMAQLDRPTVAGLDIDRVTGAVYVALCANAMVCRLNPDDLKRVEREWFLNDPQLSPSYLCITRQENEVWASCPLDDKVFILDLTTDTFTQFTPSLMFNIVPSHIICTTDERIMILDKKLSRIYWLQRVEQRICSQRIDHTVKERKKRSIDIIQPIDDTSLSECLAISRTNRFCGGIMCADRKGTYIIYPRKVIGKKNDKMVCCF